MPLDDDRFRAELDRLGGRWRVAPPPPLDEMWAGIEDRAFGAARPGPTARPWRHWAALVATLLLGVAVGRALPRGGGATGASLAATADSIRRPEVLAGARAPFVGIAAGYLEQVTALLVTLANETEAGRPLDNSRAQARDLLATTRLLLDSPGEMDPVVASLLDDLELVLVQVARLPNRPDAPDVYLIDQTLDQREVMPRLRIMLASATDPRPY